MVTRKPGPIKSTFTTDCRIFVTLLVKSALRRVDVANSSELLRAFAIHGSGSRSAGSSRRRQKTEVVETSCGVISKNCRARLRSAFLITSRSNPAPIAFAAHFTKKLYPRPGPSVRHFSKVSCSWRQRAAPQVLHLGYPGSHQPRKSDHLPPALLKANPTAVQLRQCIGGPGITFNRSFGRPPSSSGAHPGGVRIPSIAS